MLKSNMTLLILAVLLAFIFGTLLGYLFHAAQYSSKEAMLIKAANSIFSKYEHNCKTVDYNSFRDACFSDFYDDTTILKYVTNAN